MGPKYADPVILDLRAMWEESDPRTPMICLLSMGSDPTAMIEDLAKKNGIGLQFHVKTVCENSKCCLRRRLEGLNIQDILKYRVARKNVPNFRMALCNRVGEVNQQKSMYVMSKLHIRICL